MTFGWTDRTYSAGSTQPLSGASKPRIALACTLVGHRRWRKSGYTSACCAHSGPDVSFHVRVNAPSENCHSREPPSLPAVCRPVTSSAIGSADDGPGPWYSSDDVLGRSGMFCATRYWGFGGWKAECRCLTTCVQTPSIAGTALIAPPTGEPAGRTDTQSTLAFGWPLAAASSCAWAQCSAVP